MNLIATKMVSFLKIFLLTNNYLTIYPILPAFRCFNYGGALSYNEVCYSDDEKRRVFMDYLDPMGDGTPKGGEDKTKVEKKLLQELDNNSCNTTRYLECRRISDKDSPGQLPQYRCACPDHEKGGCDCA